MNKKTVGPTILFAIVTLLVILALLLLNINKTHTSTNTQPEDPVTYTSISMNEAVELMQRETDYILLDVRHDYEYMEGHIPGAILLDNDNISAETTKQFNDRSQLILIYCRSGRRSKEAAQKFVDMGYTNIIEIGGIIDWTGEIEK